MSPKNHRAYREPLVNRSPGNGDARWTFPFGRPSLVHGRLLRSARLFVIGAYPSALHVRWTPPAPYAPVAAVAVDVEPEPFWSGSDEVERVRAWLDAVGWRPEWGRAEPAGRLNGSSGAWVDAQILAPLGVERADAWITDCLRGYRASTRGAARIADTYAPFAAAMGLPEARLPAHPSEGDIVREALAGELPRIATELREAAPQTVVTLGNAALRVMGVIVRGELPSKLRPSADYGAPFRASFEGLELEVLPLAHPAAPAPYPEAHAAWRNRRPH